MPRVRAARWDTGQVTVSARVGNRPRPARSRGPTAQGRAQVRSPARMPTVQAARSDREKASGNGRASWP